MAYVLLNEEQAKARLVDLSAIKQHMPRHLWDQVELMPESAGYSDPKTLKDILSSPLTPNTVIDVNRHESDPEAVAAFDRLVQEHSRKIELQPGQILCMNNRQIVHQSMRGTLQAHHTDPEQVTRIFEAKLANR